jgi:hypothetical protein
MNTLSALENYINNPPRRDIVIDIPIAVSMNGGGIVSIATLPITVVQNYVPVCNCYSFH